MACRRREGITTPVWVIDGEMGRDELQTGKEDDGNGQHDGRWVVDRRSILDSYFLLKISHNIYFLKQFLELMYSVCKNAEEENPSLICM